MTTEFRLSRREDIPRLRRLWQDAFGDEDAYLDIFFSAAYAPERSLVLERDGNIAGGAYWMNCAWKDRKLAYVYAVAIDPGLQNQGLGTRLMEAIHRHLAAGGYDAVLLVPGSEELRRYYRRFGYRTVSHRRVTAAPDVPVPIRRISCGQYKLLRRQYLPENGIVQEGENLALLDRLAEFYAGPDFIFARSRTEPHCLEILGDADCAPGEDVPYAMGKNLSDFMLPEEVYFAFGFD